MPRSYRGLGPSLVGRLSEGWHHNAIYKPMKCRTDIGQFLTGILSWREIPFTPMANARRRDSDHGLICPRLNAFDFTRLQLRF